MTEQNGGQKVSLDWGDAQNAALIDSPNFYKTEMEFNSIEFDADRNSQIANLMANIFTDMLFFWGQKTLG